MATASTNVTSGSTLSNALSLAQLLTGGSDSTATASKNVSEDSINAAITKVLESTSGLASITGGEKTAGLYNSTVNQQLVNDLMARVAGEAASNSTSTTTTTSGTGMDLAMGLGTLGVLALTDDTFKKTAKEGLSSLADVISGIGSSTSPAASVSSLYGSLGSTNAANAMDYLGLGSTAASSTSAVSQLFGSSGTAAVDSGSWMSGIGDWFSGLWG